MNTAETVIDPLPPEIRKLPKPWQESFSLAFQLQASLPDWNVCISKGKPWPILFADPRGDRILVVGAGFVMDAYVGQGRQVLEFVRQPDSPDKRLPTSFYHPDDRKNWTLVSTSEEFRGANWQPRMICHIVCKVGRAN